MIKKVKVIAEQTNEVLFETDMSKMELAYEYAAKMEQMGIEVKIDAPTISESLADTLGLTLDDRHRLETSVTDEIDDHDGSCCASPFKVDKSKLQ